MQCSSPSACTTELAIPLFPSAWNDSWKNKSKNKTRKKWRGCVFPISQAHTYISTCFRQWNSNLLVCSHITPTNSQLYMNLSTHTHIHPNKDTLNDSLVFFVRFRLFSQTAKECMIFTVFLFISFTFIVVCVIYLTIIWTAGRLYKCSRSWLAGCLAAWLPPCELWRRKKKISVWHFGCQEMKILFRL